MPGTWGINAALDSTGTESGLTQGDPGGHELRLIEASNRRRVRGTVSGQYSWYGIIEGQSDLLSPAMKWMAEVGSWKGSYRRNWNFLPRKNDLQKIENKFRRPKPLIGGKFQSKMRKVSAVKLTISSPEKMIGEKFQSKMRKVSAEKNDLQKIENKFRPTFSSGKSKCAKYQPR